MTDTIDASLSMLELAVKYGTRDSVDRMVEIAAEFIERGTLFASRRGIDASALAALQVRIGELSAAHRFGSSIRVAAARNDTLRAIGNVRSGTSLLASEAYEARFPYWLRATQ